MKQIWYHEARQNNFESLVSQFPEQSKTSIVEAARYIADLADLRNEPIQSINLARWIAQDGKFVTDKRAINRIYFSASQPVQINHAEARVQLSPEAKTALLKIGNPFTREIEKLKQSLDSYRASIRDYEDSLAQQWAHFYTAKAKLGELEKQEPAAGYIEKVEAQLARVRALGFYTEATIVPGFRDKYENTKDRPALRLITSDVIVPVRNQRLGVDAKVNFGRFEFVIPLDCAAQDKIKVVNAGNNLPRTVYGAWHPHVWDYGLCLGNAANVFFANLKAFNLEEVARMLANILTDPNLKSSYLDIFQTAAAIEGRNVDELGTEYRQLYNAIAGVTDEQEEETEDQDEEEYQDEEYDRI